MADTKPFDTGKVEKQTPNDTSTKNEDLDTPKGLDAETWKAAELSWRNQNGGRGLSKDAKKDQIRPYYDQIVKNNQDTHKWEKGE